MLPVTSVGLANAKEQNHNNRVEFGPNIATLLKGKNAKEGIRGLKILEEKAFV